jgi:lipopolysaccharide export system permease protein
MKLVDKLVLREIFGPFLFGVAAFTSVFFAGSYLLKLTNWIMRGMPLTTAVEIVTLALPSIVVYTLPMATLLGVLLGVGRLSGDSEVIALFASGTSLYRLALPIIGLGATVSLSAIVLGELVAPWANTRAERLRSVALHEVEASALPFTLMDDATSSLIRVGGGLNPDTGEAKDVTIIRFSDGRPAFIIYAKKAVWGGIDGPDGRYRWRLISGFSQSTGDRSPACSTFDESRTRDVKIHKTPQEMAILQKKPEQMNFRELTELVAYLKTHPDRGLDQIRKLDVDRWNKFSLPLSSLVFAMVGAPLGIRKQRSASSVGLGLSILVIFVYWIVWHYTSSLAVQGSIEPPIGAFLADIVGISAAIVLLRKAET